MCQEVTWYYTLCEHLNPLYYFHVPCAKAIRHGYNCDATPLYIPLFGACSGCRDNTRPTRKAMRKEYKRRLSDTGDATEYEGDISTLESDVDSGSDTTLDGLELFDRLTF
ncbi:hypothetical protein P168DRAFT_43214 [Aspergillus campestris IBT 28561]|uniref:Uncharacterized protein n=1 Tax=Aspergillus campestris (strain IBT 28561) TaxID=1392248 RepID=A0A2I1CX97_ASPC2|nr:uncharacterized protein P168DRAFT_43214 [Aspergillus campestris IBT 28561]PKY02223.1 hypothetical protein P168DRAFT_43214 [Aspergillus campestris IBT 28561]